MRILFVLNYRKSKSGITEQVLLLKKKFEESGMEVSMVSTFGSILQRIKGMCKSVSEGRNCDLIIGAGCSYFGFYPVFAAAAAAFFLNKRLIINYHGGQAEKFLKKYGSLVKKVFARNLIVVASDYLLNVFKNAGYERVIKIDNLFDYTEYPEPTAALSKNKKVVWARSFEPLYQPEMTLDIAKELTGKYDCEFHFYGNGSMLSDLKQKYEYEKIIFHGLVERNNLLRDFADYSVLLNTTLNDNIPNTIFEAGYYGLLVISSRVGGIDTTFTENEIEFAESNQKDEYIKLLSGYFDEPDKYDGKRIRLIGKVKSYTWENIKDKWLEILNSAGQ